jgi:hypothetical protein
MLHAEGVLSAVRAIAVEEGRTGGVSPSGLGFFLERRAFAGND